jgi:hypothetical protein
MVMRMVRNETQGQRPDLERRAEQLFKGQDTLGSWATIHNNSIDGGKRAQDAVALLPASKKAKAVQSTPQTKKDVVERVASNNEQPKDAVAINPTRAQEGEKGNSASKSIKRRTFKDLVGVKDGYYVVANVYKAENYLQNFLRQLNSGGIDANYIDNPNNGLKYVYLERYDTWEEAEAAAASNLNGKYTGNTWVMNVDNRYTNEAYAANVDKINERTSEYNVDDLRTNVIVKDKVPAADKESKPIKIDGVGSGYYIIANVFANPNNANRFVKLLNSYGLSASYFINPENNYRYVYLKYHESWNNALISYYSRLNNAYTDKMWIMKVSTDLMS